MRSEGVDGQLWSMLLIFTGSRTTSRPEVVGVGQVSVSIHSHNLMKALTRGEALFSGVGSTECGVRRIPLLHRLSIVQGGERGGGG